MSAWNKAMRPRTRRGQAIIEFAFVGVSSVALLTASFDFSHTVFSRAVIRHAVRVGVRFAATGRTLSGMNQDASIRSIVKANSFGLLTGQDALIKIRYYSPVDGVITNSNAQRNLVEVAIEGLQKTPLAPLMRSGQLINLDMNAVGAVEPFPGNPPIR